MSTNSVVKYFKSQVKKGEWAPLIWSFLYFYFLLTSYFVVRPIRETMGVTAGGREIYDVLFTATFIVMLLLQPLYGKIVSKYSRKQFIPIIYGFFTILMLVFWVTFQKFGTENITLAKIYFVFVSVFNLFVVSVFWSFMADVYTKEQGKRLFGVIAAGGSTGGISGGIITSNLVERIGTINMMLISAGFLLVCILIVIKIRKYANESEINKEAPLGGSPLEGLKLTFSSKLLMQIAIMTVMSVLIGGIFYTLQAEYIKQNYADRDVQTAIFANVNTFTNSLTLFFQLILTPFLLQKIKIHKILGIYPTIMIFAFMVFGALPVLQIVLAGIVLQRSGAYGLMKPPTDWLFTGLDKKIKYKFKNFLDTVIYRGGDVFTQLIFINLVGYFTKSLRVFAIFGVLFSIIWLINAIKVGKLAHQTFDAIKKD